jgi:hypothetical protein
MRAKPFTFESTHHGQIFFFLKQLRRRLWSPRKTFPLHRRRMLLPVMLRHRWQTVAPLAALAALHFFTFLRGSNTSSSRQSLRPLMIPRPAAAASTVSFNSSFVMFTITIFILDTPV